MGGFCMNRFSRNEHQSISKNKSSIKNLSLGYFTLCLFIFH